MEDYKAEISEIYASEVLERAFWYSGKNMPTLYGEVFGKPLKNYFTYSLLADLVRPLQVDQTPIDLNSVNEQFRAKLKESWPAKAQEDENQDRKKYADSQRQKLNNGMLDGYYLKPAVTMALGKSNIDGYVTSFYGCFKGDYTFGIISQDSNHLSDGRTRYLDCCGSEKIEPNGWNVADAFFDQDGRLMNPNFISTESGIKSSLAIRLKSFNNKLDSIVYAKMKGKRILSPTVQCEQY